NSRSSASRSQSATSTSNGPGALMLSFMNKYRGSHNHALKQIKHIDTVHANTADRPGHPPPRIVRHAEKIDGAAPGIAFAEAIEGGLLPAQPRDAGQYPVTLRRCRGHCRRVDFSSRPAAAKHRIDGFASADLCADAMPTPRRAVTAIAFTGTIARC